MHYVASVKLSNHLYVFMLIKEQNEIFLEDDLLIQSSFVVLYVVEMIN